MKNRSLKNFALLMILTFAATIGCSGLSDEKSCSVNPLLKPLLNARDDKAFDDLLQSHGPVKEEELPCIIAAAKSWNSTKQYRAASLLVIAKGDEQVIFDAEKQIVAETKNVLVWAKIMESLIYLKDPRIIEVAALRPDLINEALTYTNEDEKRLEGKVQSTGLKAGAMAKIQGIEDEIRKRLDSDNAMIAEVALDAMPEEMIKAELPRLLKMLDDYEAGKTYTGFRNVVFTALITALARSGEPKAFTADKNSIEVGLKNSHLVGGSRDELSDFRNKIVFIPGDFVEKFCLYLIRENGSSKHLAFDIMVTRITRKLDERSIEIVKECVQLIENGELSNDPLMRNYAEFNVTGQLDCERLIHFLETGEYSTGKIKYGRDSLPAGRKWLKEH